MDERGISLLHRMKQTSLLPVLTKPGAIRQMDETCQRQFALDAQGDDLYPLCRKQLHNVQGGSAWVISPVIFRRNG
jgi:hypothetical protein